MGPSGVGTETYRMYNHVLKCTSTVNKVLVQKTYTSVGAQKKTMMDDILKYVVQRNSGKPS